jgi:type III secretion system YscD/HrpQ family protein
MYLDARSYRLGRSDTSDIVVRDETLPEHLLDINVEEKNVSLHSLSKETSIYVDGLKHENDTLTVQKYSVYSIGLLYFCFGETGEEWPVIKMPTYSHTTTDIKRAGVGGYLTSIRHSKALLNFSLIFAFALISAVFSNSKLDAGIIPQTIVNDSIQTINDMGYGGLVIEKIAYDGAGNDLQIHGYVDTAVELSKLKRTIARQGIHANIDVRVMAYVRKSTEVLLKQFKYSGLVVSFSDKEGELTISGVIKDLPKWNKTKARLLSDIPGLLSIKDLIQTQESRITLLKQWIDEENLNNDIVINAANGKLMISSELALNESVAWNRITQKFEEMFNDKLNLVVMNNARPTLAIRSVSYGEIPYFILDSGQKYIQGAHVYDGFYLHKIEKKSVVLQRGEETLNYHIGR